jgi:hypothetical protein
MLSSKSVTYISIKSVRMLAAAWNEERERGSCRRKRVNARRGASQFVPLTVVESTVMELLEFQ